MQQADLTYTCDGEKGTKVCDDRRKRINRIKIELIILIIILMTLPTILCIILGFRVGRLQKQVDDLLRMQIIGAGQADWPENPYDDKHYAYAAVQEKKLNELFQPFEADMVEEAAEASKASKTGELAEASKAGELTEASTADELTEGSTADELAEGSTAGESVDTSSSTPAASPPSVEEGVHKGRYTGKKVYLTFDDGPSIFTDDILDIMEEYQVKATFFVIGQADTFSKNIYKRIVEDGHTLGMHSYSHKYSEIYNSLEDFEKDFTKLWKLLYDTTGYKPSIFRFPGGSDNRVNKHGMEDFIRYLNDAGIVYFDWNVDNGDATRMKYTKEQLIDNVLKGVEIKKNAIVLMHDAANKKNTVDSLPDLLDVLTSEGAQILPLDNEVTPIQMIKADSIK